MERCELIAKIFAVAMLYKKDDSMEFMFKDSFLLSFSMYDEDYECPSAMSEFVYGIEIRDISRSDEWCFLLDSGVVWLGDVSDEELKYVWYELSKQYSGVLF